MREDPLDYGKMMQAALKSLMAEALGYVAENGLPEEHHFYITFNTNDPDVEIPDWLHRQYPQELTIVLQHEFFDLAVIQKRFTVKLSFNDQLATLVVPFDAVKTFADPSAEFGLRFDPQLPDTDTETENIEKLSPIPKEDSKLKSSQKPEKDKTGISADIVSLDTFRKN